MGAEQLMNKKYFAALFDVSTRTINRWMADGVVKPYRRGRVVRFGIKQIEQAKAHMGDDVKDSGKTQVN